jgi:glutathione synthase/RimK-type ligase-like ATP-grasp enzyme
MSHPAETRYMGLAPFLRLSINGNDLRPIAQALLEKAGQDETNPFLWMNLATAFFSIGEHQSGLAILQQALQMQREYRIDGARQPARCRLLVLSVMGDISENTPIDCLLEDSPVDLLYYYATPEQPLPPTVPEHDVVLVAVCDSLENRPLLAALERVLADWDKPVINQPASIPNTERRRASELLQGVPGLAMPPTCEIDRDSLISIALGEAGIGGVFAGCRFPIILRPVGSHAGRDLARIDDARGIAAYLSSVADKAFYLSNFIDYSGADGLFRKHRVALVDGKPFACHTGISAHWMIHYLNAGMYEDAAKRAEEAAFMESFPQFAERHKAALAEIQRRSGMDYVCLDCAETKDGDLLIFEIDHAMVVHAMDPADLFPYKQVHMAKVREAFENYLFRLMEEEPVCA